MPKEFVHSIKVPRLYKSAAKIIQEVREKGGSLKSLIYNQRHPNKSAIYSLCVKTLQKEGQIDSLINKTNLLINEPRFDAWLAKILITELLWGKNALKTDCKPIKTILAYEQKLREELNNIGVDAFPTSSERVKNARYVRINTLLVTLKKGISYFQEEGWSLLPKCSNYIQHLNIVKNLKKPNFIQDFHISEILVFPPDTIFYDHPGYQNGEIILQDKASCLPSYLLNPEPGSIVLDMCAAPGMKTSHLAALLTNTGKIYAVEKDEHRYKTLCEQIKLTNASCVETINKDSLTLEANEYSKVEYILVDPSCSGSGMLDRQIVYGKEKRDPQRLKQLQAFQVFLLRHALLNFPNVKRVVYSTCSTHSEENEEVIDEILENIQNAYELVPIKRLLNEEWLNFSSKKYKCSDKCLYAISDVDMCNDFFVAVFERNFNISLPEYKHKENNASNNKIEEIEINDEKTTTRKRKKRGKRKTNQENSKDINIDDNSIKEINNDNDSSQSDGDESSQNNDVDSSQNKFSQNDNDNELSENDTIEFFQNNSCKLSDNNDSEPVIKKKKMKLKPHKIRRLSIRKELKLPKKKGRPFKNIINISLLLLRKIFTNILYFSCKNNDEIYR
ncbi:probable 28S rRNA (cytosine-C(5))-methyltransferase [Apis florea]|uniref:probable 28S rRNA (cytosine-C(5))-methyltransferase n=1 Tax=Apis florea TaxID=7463 RepID=UPI0012FE801F|nr:probable 28S rRNA (cytosine-C(5))-methyltransferase [Apis florea]